MALPAERETAIEELAQHHADRFRDWLEERWEQGLAIFGKAKPQDRLRWYMSQTLAQDMGMVLDLDYREKRKQGLAGPLTVELQFQQYQEQATLVTRAQQEAEAEKMQMPQLPELVPPPMMWVHAMAMPAWFMVKVQRDFRHCVDDQAAREGISFDEVLRQFGMIPNGVPA